jgi:hypothetical protein
MVKCYQTCNIFRIVFTITFTYTNQYNYVMHTQNDYKAQMMYELGELSNINFANHLSRLEAIATVVIDNNPELAKDVLAVVIDVSQICMCLSKYRDELIKQSQPENTLIRQQ